MLYRLLLVYLCSFSVWHTGFTQSAPEFDFYVLSLSWSPEFCAVKPDNRQCGRGYGLVLHGLWPQNERGYPQDCSSERLPGQLLQSFTDLYPDTGLAFHGWKKHGTCSGLSPKNYLQLSQTLKNQFVTPAPLQALSSPLRINAQELQAQIVAANPRLTPAAILFSCADSGRFLQEIYVCYDAQGEHATSCSAEMQRRSQKSCGQGSFLVRNLR